MLIKSESNLWLTSAHHVSIDPDGAYLPSGVVTVSDELGAYLVTLDGVSEVKQPLSKKP